MSNIISDSIYIHTFTDIKLNPSADCNRNSWAVYAADRQHSHSTGGATRAGPGGAGRGLSQRGEPLEKFCQRIFLNLTI